MTTPNDRHQAHASSGAEDVFDVIGNAIGGGDQAYDAMKTLNHVHLLPDSMQDYLLFVLRHASDFFQNEYFIQSFENLGNYYHRLGQHSTLYHSNINHKLVTEDSHGRIRVVPHKKHGTAHQTQLYELFPPETSEDPHAESRWPKLILTSSHARGGNRSDIASILHGIESLVTHCFKSHRDKKDFGDFKFQIGDLCHPPQQQQPAHQQTLMMAFACDVESNSFLNAASLLRRIRELSEIPRHVVSKILGTSQDSYRHASPGAFRLAKVMLQCLVTEPERIDTDFKGFVSKQPNLDSRPLDLRPDAVQVAQHLALVGYSKGGNVVSDAMRILKDELMQKRGETSVFRMAETPRFTHSYAQLADYKPIHDYGTRENPLLGVKRLLENIPLLSIAALEVPLTRNEQLAGIRRVSINNRKDWLSAHTKLQYGSGADEVIWVDGERDFFGHAPADALGTKDKDGYILHDPHACRRIEEYFCALHGAAAISNLVFDAGTQTVSVIPAAGTSDFTMLKQCGTITNYLQQAGFTHVKVGPQHGEIVISVNEPLFLNDGKKTGLNGYKRQLNGHVQAANRHVSTDQSHAAHANVLKLAEVFKRIREQEPNLVINTAVDNDIATHARAMAPNSRGVPPRQEPSEDYVIGLMEGTARGGSGNGCVLS